MHEVKFDSSLYSEINNDEELKKFFNQLFEFYKFYQKIFIDLRDSAICKIKPDFTPLKKKICQLEKRNILVEKYDLWFDSNSYVSGEKYTVARGLFLNATFDGIKLTHDDFIGLQSISIDGETTTPYYQKNIQKYNILITKKTKIEKQLKNANKKWKSTKYKKNLSMEMSDSDKKVYTKLRDTDRQLHDINKELNKIIFLKSLSLEKINLLMDVFLEISKMYDLYSDFFHKKKVIIEKFHKIKNKPYYSAYEKLIKENEEEIDIENIKSRLFKILVFNELDETKKQNEDFGEIDSNYIEMIDLFIMENEEYFKEIYNLTFDNFDLMLEKEKVLKK